MTIRCDLLNHGRKTPLQEGYSQSSINFILESQNIHCATFSLCAESSALLTSTGQILLSLSLLLIYKSPTYAQLTSNLCNLAFLYLLALSISDYLPCSYFVYIIYEHRCVRKTFLSHLSSTFAKHEI